MAELQFFEDAQKVIDKVSDFCKETGSILNKLLDRVRGLCSEKDKVSLFDEIKKALAEAKEDCPSMIKEIETLEQLFNDNQGHKCSGG